VRSVDSVDWERVERPPDDEAGQSDCDSEAFKRRVAHLSAISQSDFDDYIAKIERPKLSEGEIKALIPKWVYDQVPALFNPRMADKLTPRRPGVDHAIDTEAGQIPKPKVYGLTRRETEAVKAYIDEMLGKGFVKPSTSPYAAPVLVVKKPGGGLRICVDYRAPNNITKKNRNAPPAIKETFARLAKVKLMTLVDCCSCLQHGPRQGGR
jgi:hypothetical protein